MFLWANFMCRLTFPVAPWTLPEVGRDGISIPIVSSEGSSQASASWLQEQRSGLFALQAGHSHGQVYSQVHGANKQINTVRDKCVKKEKDWEERARMVRKAFQRR